jgi:isoamylase
MPTKPTLAPVTSPLTGQWHAVEGSPHPLGVTWIEAEQAWNFALYSRHATGVTLLLYGNLDFVNPSAQVELTPLKNKSSRVWHCRVRESDMPNARYYAYSVDGPNAPAEGHRFDAQKILLDPYAKSVFFPPLFSREAARRAGSNAGRAPLGVISCGQTPFDWGDDRRPRHTSDTVIYEMHVRGFTRRDNSGVSADARGAFAGVIEKIPYLKDLGVTAVELLPVFQYDPQERNYWGYMTLNFFSPHESYASVTTPEGVVNEFRAMVKALHEADIEVILDVVYNHTTELDENGPTYSFRGIDNSTYYLLDKNDLAVYRNDAGTGNVMRSSHPAARKMILDGLRFWVREMHVDGFRFDLASIFTRNDDGAINFDDPPVISEISADPELANVRLIAEAWDVTSYQLGRSFPGVTWAQWNGQFRDDARSFVKSDRGTVSKLMTRLYGSDDLFPDRSDDAYHPYQSINFITAHDGFCLHDLVSYNAKRNEANGQQNRDGGDDNRSWNCGFEGEANAPPEVIALRKRQLKNFCALLMLANGAPMIVAGDEFANTQRGNNNPFNQDNETTWLDWSRLETNADIFRFFKLMIAFRKTHPSLSRSRFWREDVAWYGVGNRADTGFFSHTLAFCLHGAAEGDTDIYAMINAYWEDLTFTIQEGAAGEWRRVVDTSLDSPLDIAEPGAESPLDSLAYAVKARSVVMLKRG